MLRPTRSLILWAAATAAIIVASLFGGAGLYAQATGAASVANGTEATSAPKLLPAVETASLYPIGNNASVALEPRKYLGKLFIESYGVKIAGVPGTTIDGDVFILANSFRMSGVTITGTVSILGSNADLSGCTIDGKVVSRGANNKW